MIINLFGSTGEIGKKTLKLIKNYYPRIKVNLLCANKNVYLILKQINTFNPNFAYLHDEESSNRLQLKISNKTLKFNKESKENGELYGSIKPKEVSNAFKTFLGVEINPSQIDLRQEITQVGKYKININLHAEVTASVNLTVDKIDSI